MRIVEVFQFNKHLEKVAFQGGKAFQRKPFYQATDARDALTAYIESMQLKQGKNEVRLDNNIMALLSKKLPIG